jgi:N-methylhydantoinase A
MDAGDSVRLGIDVGGTFTDIYCEGSTPADAIIAKVRTSAIQQGGLPAALVAAGIDIKRARSFVYSTTLATNAILERALPECALVTTRGFRDVLELGRRDRPHTYGLDGSFTPLVPRHLRFELSERVSAEGEVLCEPDAAEVAELCERLHTLAISAVVVGFLNSYANDTNERAVAGMIAARLPTVPVVSSAATQAEWGEFDRFTLAVLQGLLLPVVGDHLSARKHEVDAMGFAGDMFAMQSNGGVIPVDHARRRPVQLVLSGPAAGVIGASVLAGHRSSAIVTCDMGGTSFDVGLLQNGRPAMTSRSHIAFRVPLAIPTVDVHEIAAGGSSVVHVVGHQLIVVGPESVGSDPGPACYGLGGDLPTITDAAVVLNRFAEGQAFGTLGEIEPSASLAKRAVERRVAEPLGISAISAAEAIVARAATVMAGGIRAMSVGRGHDPRLTMLFVAGGAGPLFACDFAREAGIRDIIVPPYPGVVNAIGCALTDLRQDYSRTLNIQLAEHRLDDVRRVLSEQQAAATAFLDQIGDRRLLPPVFVLELDMQYVGQTHTVTVPIRGDNLTRQALLDQFRIEYTRSRGVPLETQDINIRTVRTVLFVPRAHQRMHPSHAAAAPTPASRASVVGTQDVVIGGVPTAVSVYERHLLEPSQRIAGPSLVRQPDCTVWLAPGATGDLDTDGSLLISLEKR